MDTIRTSDMHVYSHLDPMDTIWTKGVHVYGHLEVVMALLEGGRERAGRGPFCPRPGKREGISFLILA